MNGGGKASFLAWGRCLIIWLLAAVCYFSSLRVYLGMGENPAIPVFFSSVYPDQNRAGEILETEQKRDNPADLCFYWDGGIQKAVQKDYGRQTEVLTVGLLGDAGLYDWRAGLLSGTDRDGCIIDRNTALDLFGSAQAEGGMLQLGKNTYQVRKVVPWKQKVVLIRKYDKETVYTRMLVRFSKGENQETAVDQLLMRHGLSGSAAEEGLMKSLPLLALLLLPAVLFGELFRSAWKERKTCRESSWESWCWTGACILMAGAAVFLIWRYVRIPVDWMPGKWSDFQFWPDKIKSEIEKMKLYLMMPKTVPALEQMLTGVKSGVLSLAALIIYVGTRKLQRRG
ncbi:MAG: hypothetical protein Q4D16_03200 [Eubacteriales bacterium]|nr:hypothetical protein [Eubacteriales bacterium]